MHFFKSKSVAENRVPMTVGKMEYRSRIKNLPRLAFLTISLSNLHGFWISFFLLRAECLLYVMVEKISNFNLMLDDHNMHKVEERISVVPPLLCKKCIIKLGFELDFLL